MGRSLALALGALALGACKERAAPPAPSPSTSASAPPLTTPLPARAVSGEVAFELVAVEAGALCAWGEPSGGLSVALLDASGRAQGEPLKIAGAASGSVLEVAGGSLGNRVGLAWLSRSEQGAASFGSLGDAETRSFSAAFPLTDATLGDVAKRGHVAFAVSDKNEMVALTRGLDEPCSEPKGASCAAFRFRELLSTGPELRGLPISVPSPCPAPVAGFELVKERWHYGFCSRESGGPNVTTFMRQLAPFYVGVQKPAPGCTPLGSTRVGADALFVFQCGDARRGVRVGDLNASERSVDLGQVKLECALGRPRLVAPGSPALQLDLSAPLSGLGPLLPADVAPAPSRAVWTGTSLLAASWMKGRVVLRRYECRGAELVRTG